MFKKTMAPKEEPSIEDLKQERIDLLGALCGIDILLVENTGASSLFFVDESILDDLGVVSAAVAVGKIKPCWDSKGQSSPRNLTELRRWCRRRERHISNELMKRVQ